MSHTIRVIKGEKNGFRVLVNCIQDGCELHSPHLANIHATNLQKRYPSAILCLIAIEGIEEKTSK